MRKQIDRDRSRKDNDLPENGESGGNTAQTVLDEQVCAILDSVTDGFVGIGWDWTYYYVNAAGAAFLKSDKEELIGRHIFDAFPEARGTVFEKHFRVALEEKKQVTFEAIYEPLNTWFECRCYPSPHGISIFFRDTTEEKKESRKQEKLLDEMRRSVKRLEGVINVMSEGIFISDLEGNLLNMNQAAMSIYGFDSKEMTPQQFADYTKFFTLSDLEGNLIPIKKWPISRVVKGESLAGEEIRVLREDTGMERICSFGGAPVVGDENEPLFAVVTAYDITRQKQIQQDLRHAREEMEERVRQRTIELESAKRSLEQQNEVLQKIVNHIPVMLVFYDQQGNVLLVSQEFERLTGWRLEDFQEIDIMEACYPNPEYRRMVWEYMMEASTRWRDLEVSTRNGEILESSWANVRLSDGSQIGIGIDIRERRIAEEKLQTSRQRLQELSRKTMELLENERQAIANEIHDSIGASLAAIKFSLESRVEQMNKVQITDGKISFEKIIGYLHDTIKETKRISARLRPMTLDVLGIISTIEWYLRQCREMYSEIHFDSNVSLKEKEVPETLKIILYRVLQEAINNAVRHSGASIVRVSLSRTDEVLVLQVEDNGSGFDPKQFYGRTIGMRGYGLHSMQERVEICGGEFWITTKPGQGTLVHADMPINTVC